MPVPVCGKNIDIDLLRSALYLFIVIVFQVLGKKDWDQLGIGLGHEILF